MRQTCILTTGRHHRIAAARRHRVAGFTLADLLAGTAVGMMVLGVLVSTSISLQRSLTATEHFARASNDGSRVLDYVVRDLRRAVRVGLLSGGNYSPVKSNSTFAITAVNTLAIQIPDYYASNSPGSGSGEDFRSSRYARSTLNLLSLFNGNGADALNGTVFWKDAVTDVDGVETTRFAPADLSAGEIQVRYYRAPRSAADPTLCLFRAEHTVGSATPNFPPEEIAERVFEGDQPLTVFLEAPNLSPSDPVYGRAFRVRAAFVPRYQRISDVEPTIEHSLTVVLRNRRRD